MLINSNIADTIINNEINEGHKNYTFEDYAREVYKCGDYVDPLIRDKRTRIFNSGTIPLRKATREN